MRSFWAALRIGLKDMRPDLRRFLILIVSLALGTSLVAGVNLIGDAVSSAMDHRAAELMGGNFEISRADRPANATELARLADFGRFVATIDTNVRAEADGNDAFIDLAVVGQGYPLLGAVESTGLPAGEPVFDALAEQDGRFGALIAPVLLDALGVQVGDTFTLAGTPFQVRGTLLALPDALVRGFRLGSQVLITEPAFARLSDPTSPLPGLGNWYRYKLLADGQDDAATLAALDDSFLPLGWTVRSARDGLGPVVHYYDLFMRFLMLVGIGSLLLVGLSVWTGMRAYIGERGNVIAILRSLGAERSRILVHFFTQIGIVALVGVGIGAAIGAAAALMLLPIIGQAVGIPLTAEVRLAPLLVASGAGLLTVFTFAYLPLLQAQAVQPAELFRLRGLGTPPMDWRLLFSWKALPLLAGAIGLVLLAIRMTGDVGAVLAFAGIAVVTAAVFMLVMQGLRLLSRHVPESRFWALRYAIRAILGAGSNAAMIVVSIGIALVLLIFVLVLETNLRQEFLGASAFDAPTFVASDLFEDEADTIAALVGPETGITRFVATPMLRGTVTEINGAPVDSVHTRGPEASFLLAGQVPLTFRAELPASSRLVDGDWWPADYSGPPLVSLHRNLAPGLGVKVGDTLTFDIFGDTITARIANFRDYSWQGGIDFLATFSPGVLDAYPTTLFAAVTAAKGMEATAERRLAAAVPDLHFIAIGDTLAQVTNALSQLSLAAALVGGLAVANGLIVLAGSLATGRKQRQMDAVITKVLGATRSDLLSAALLQFLLLAILAAIPATAFGILLGWAISGVMLNVAFSVNWPELATLLVVAPLTAAVLGAIALVRPASTWPARLLRGAE